MCCAQLFFRQRMIQDLTIVEKLATAGFADLWSLYKLIHKVILLCNSPDVSTSSRLASAARSVAAAGRKRVHTLQKYHLPLQRRQDTLVYVFTSLNKVLIKLHQSCSVTFTVHFNRNTSPYKPRSYLISQSRHSGAGCIKSYRFGYKHQNGEKSPWL